MRRTCLLLLLCFGWCLCVASTELQQLLKLKWLDNEQLKTVHQTVTEARGGGSWLSFYPEARLLQNSTVLAVCQLAVDADSGFGLRAMQLQQMDDNDNVVRRFDIYVATPLRRLEDFVAKANPLNYKQVCKPPCPGQAALGSGGRGFFQFTGAGASGLYSCSGTAENLLPPEERPASKQASETLTVSKQQRLLAYNASIGQPRLHNATGGVVEFSAGSEMSAACSVENSVPGSQFELVLLLMRQGSAGASVEDELSVTSIGANRTGGSVQWRGEKATVSLHGCELVCRLRQAWGSVPPAVATVQVHYMYPVIVTNPRIRYRFYGSRDSVHNVKQSNILLRRGEYATCFARGFPHPTVEWFGDSDAFWILNETIFVRNDAAVKMHSIRCRATHEGLMLRDQLTLSVKVSACHTEPHDYALALCCCAATFVIFFAGILQ